MVKLKRIHAIALAAVMALAIAVPFAIAQSKDAGGHRHGMRGGAVLEALPFAISI